MTNKIKGTQNFSVDGKDYTLCMSINAYAELESDGGMDMQKLFSTLAEQDTQSFTLYRKLFFYGLQDFHPDITLRGAGLIMSQIGLTEALNLLVAAIQASMPSQAKAGDSPLVKAAA